ncbi:uncharacterized protein LOC109602040 [Aethina tumida]|uniref:uncharacterized protein LOC109602040 n=1 Tax=Aethina tumida TaxID=116153 RepID=UPI00096AF4AE|nr:uncharacterized protein LOC109602040 [Aethina tumida]
MRSLLTGMFLITSLYLLFIHQLQSVQPAHVPSADLHRVRARPINRFNKPLLNQLARIKEPVDAFIVDEDDLFDLAKRQTSEDYGHLRFGKRDEQFDDYGHMRFGRGGD